MICHVWITLPFYYKANPECQIAVETNITATGWLIGSYIYIYIYFAGVLGMVSKSNQHS